MQQQDNYHYTFEELQTYLYSYADLFQQDRVQDGIHLYSKNAKNIFKEMQKVNDKIREKKEKYNKKIKEKRAKMVEAMQAYTKKHRDDENCNANMLEDPDVKHWKGEMEKLEAKLDNAVKTEQDKFMQWEKKEMKGRNVIMRNNNYISAAGKSNAIKKGLIRSNEIASFGNVNIQNSKNETISGNLADIVHSVTNLLHQKAQEETDEAKKSEIEKVIQMIINGAKKFFGIRTDKKEELEKQSNLLNQALTTIIEKYLDNNFKQVQTNLDVIKQKNEQEKKNYQSATKDTSDLSSDLSASEKDNIVSQLAQVSGSQNEKQVIDDKDKPVSASANQNAQQTNKNIKTNLSKTETQTDKKNAHSNNKTHENENIDAAKLLDKKATDNKSRTNTSQDNNIKSAIQNKNTATKIEQKQEKELSKEELDKQVQQFMDKQSETHNDKNNVIEDDDINDEVIVNDGEVTDINDMPEVPEEFQKGNVKENTNKNKTKDVEKLNFDQPNLDNKINNKSRTKANNIKILIKDKQNDTTIKAPIVNNGIKEAKGAQIGSGNGS